MQTVFNCFFLNNIHIHYMSVYQIPKICQPDAAHFGNHNNVCNKFSDTGRPISSRQHQYNSQMNKKQTTYKD